MGQILDLREKGRLEDLLASRVATEEQIKMAKELLKRLEERRAAKPE